MALDVMGRGGEVRCSRTCPTGCCTQHCPIPAQLHTSSAQPVYAWPQLGYEWEQPQLCPISILSPIQAQQLLLVWDHSLPKLCMCTIHPSKQTLLVPASTIHQPPTPLPEVRTL